MAHSLGGQVAHGSRDSSFANVYMSGPNGREYTLSLRGVVKVRPFALMGRRSAPFRSEESSGRVLREKLCICPLVFGVWRLHVQLERPRAHPFAPRSRQSDYRRGIL